MATVPHSVPTRLAHLTAELYGHDDDTLIAWRQTCVHATDALRTQYAGERLSTALALAQDGAVVLDADGRAVVTSGANRYEVQADGTCTCPDYARRQVPCKHVLAVLIHSQTLALLEPTPAPWDAAPPVPQAAPTATPPVAPTAADWHVQEAPASCCLRLRVGDIELMYTMRDVSDAELTSRVQHLVPWVQDVLAQAQERQAQLAALRAQRAAARPAAATAQAPAQAAPADVQTLIQQAVHQALTTQQANGHLSTPAATPTADDQATGFCSLHQVAMPSHTDAETGDTWQSHWCEEERRYCRGRRPQRRRR
jgi:hypothetical protein